MTACAGAAELLERQAVRAFEQRDLPLLAACAFVCATELLHWAKWPLTGEISLLRMVALPVYFYYQQRGGGHDCGRPLRGAWWLIA